MVSAIMKVEVAGFCYMQTVMGIHGIYFSWPYNKFLFFIKPKKKTTVTIF